MKNTEQAEADIRNVLRGHARLARDVATLMPASDLYQAGMSSHASVNVMLALEGSFDVEFPDRMLKRSVFASIHAIKSALVELGAVTQTVESQTVQA